MVVLEQPMSENETKAIEYRVLNNRFIGCPVFKIVHLS